MATRKLIQQNTDGTKSEYAGKITSAGASDSGEFVVLDSAGKIDQSMMPNGVGADAVTLVAGEALVAGNFVYINGSGQVMKADATAIGKKAVGYVLTSVPNAANATVYFDESNTALTGLTPGSTYYLSPTAGIATTTAPTAAGQIVQELGVATSATSIHVSIKGPIIRA